MLCDFSPALKQLLLEMSVLLSANMDLQYLSQYFKSHLHRLLKSQTEANSGGYWPSPSWHPNSKMGKEREHG